MRSAYALALAAAIALDGCSGDSGDGHQACTGGCRTVSRAVTYWAESGATTTVPEQATVSALVPLPAGGYSTVAATAIGTGAWSFSDLAPGPVLLRIETPGRTDFVETSATAVDIGRDMGGRPDPGSGDPPVDMTFGLSGLDPWDVDRDQLQLFSWQTRWWDLFPPFEPVGGEEAVDVFYTWYGPPLATGDVVHAVQSRSAALVGDFQPISSVAAGSATISTAAPASVAIAMEPLAANRAIDLDWRATEFEALGASMGTGQTAYAMPHILLVAAIPAPLALPSPVVNAASIDYLDLVGPEGSADLAATLDYAAHMGAAYREFLYVSFHAGLARTAPGASSARTIYAALYQQQDLATVPATLAPMVGPVAPQIAGLDALGDLAGVGTTPLLKWSLPSLGEATHYEVDIWEVYANGTMTARRPVASFLTTGRKIEVPTGVLEVGKAYVAVFRAVWSPDDEPEGAPFRSGLPRAVAETLSGVLQP